MSFNESTNNTFVTPDKMQAMNRLAKSSIYWHGVYEDEMDKIKNATLKITNFLIYDFKLQNEEEVKIRNMTKEQIVTYLDGKPMNSENPIIYPYAPENQADFSSNLTELSVASHSIYPVILNIQKEFNSMNFESRLKEKQNSNTGPTSTVVMPQPRSLSLFGKKEKDIENVTDITAYSRSTDLIDRLMQVPVIATKYASYHWERVTDSMTMLRGKRKSQLNLLAVEMVHYNSVVSPMILNAVGEAMRINLLSEKRDIVQILGRGQEMHERRDMQPQMTPTE